MNSRKRRRAILEEERRYAGTREDAIRSLLYELCIRWGFCGGSHPPVQPEDVIDASSDEFARVILLAEGFPDNPYSDYRKKIAEKHALWLHERGFKA